MSEYNNEELNQEWEFKIVRSSTHAFRDKTVLKELVEKGRQGQWELVEKFDNGRLRFKRRLIARQDDETISDDYDPYGTQYGIGNVEMTLLIVVGFFILVAIVLS